MPNLMRRTVLQGLAAGSGAALTGGAAPVAAQMVKWSGGTERPRDAIPAGTVDCHHHIYDRRFPIAPSASLQPDDATVADYHVLQARLGTTRNVVVQPSTYGTDNRLLMEALSQFGAQARGIAVVDTGVSDLELKALNAAGVRGIRFNLIQSGATTFEMVEPLASRIAPLGWHVQLHMTGDQILPVADVLRRLPVPIVFDHIGRLPQPAGIQHPAFALIRRLLDGGRTWIKMSGPYQDTRVGPPTYADVASVARRFAAANPDRMVWASDWPHPTERLAKPDDAQLMDLLTDWVPDAATRVRILVRNPELLYGFPPV